MWLLRKGKFVINAPIILFLKSFSLQAFDDDVKFLHNRNCPVTSEHASQNKAIKLMFFKLYESMEET